MMINKQYIAAAVIEHNGKILIAQRAKQDSSYGKWEFPGGKVEAGESLQECLKRELFEELDIHIEPGEYFATNSFYHDKTSFEMCVFKVYSFSGEMKLNEHAALAWVTPEELSNYSFTQPDFPIVSLLQQKKGSVENKNYFYFLKKQIYSFGGIVITFAVFRYLAQRFFSIEPTHYELAYIVAYAFVFIVLGAYIQYHYKRTNV